MKLNVPMLIAFVLAVVLAVIVAYLPGPGGKEQLALGIGYALLVLIFMFGLAVLISIVTGAIDLSGLLEEVDGGASTSRFQLLIFTFTIALSLFLIVARNPTAGFPPIPNAVLLLLGISSSTYAVSKGIQMGNQAPTEDETEKQKDGGKSGN